MTATFPRPQAGDVGDSARTFFARFLKSPLSVASPFESSDRLVRRLLDPLDWSRIRLVVEYGAGTGSFTRHALRRLPADARLLAIDTDPAFTRTLTETLPDRRLTALTGSAEDAREMLGAMGVDRADCIISGLPFSALDRPRAERLVAQSAALLGETGIFAAYQVRSTLEHLLHAQFATVRKSYEWRNIPPCHLYWAGNGAARLPGTG